MNLKVLIGSTTPPTLETNGNMGCFVMEWSDVLGYLASGSTLPPKSNENLVPKK